MNSFLQIVLMVAVRLASVTVLVTALLQTQVFADEVKKPGAVPVDQTTEAPKGQPRSGTPPSCKEESKPRGESINPNIQKEQQAPRSRGLQAPPAAAGTKKIGGQIIRNQKESDGE